MALFESSYATACPVPSGRTVVERRPKAVKGTTDDEAEAPTKKARQEALPTEKHSFSTIHSETLIKQHCLLRSTAY